jgi:hypothetical protein
MRGKRVSSNDRVWSFFALTNGTRPPLVFSPPLCAAASALLKSGAKPVRNTRFNAGPAVGTAGYANDKETLAMFAMDSPSLAIAYLEALSNSIGMIVVNPQESFEDYAGVHAIKDDWREAGVAVAVAGGKFRVVLVLGQGTAQRHLGGIAYADAKRNGRYDSGEGKAGVKVACGTATMTTGAGGAWWLGLDSPDPGEVSFAYETFTTVRPLAKDASNQLVDWRLPNSADLKTADRLTAKVEKELKNPDPDKSRAALADLLAGTRRAILDDDRQKKVDALVEPVREDFETTLKRLCIAFSDEPADFKKRLAEIQKPWKGAMAAWFKEADAVAKMRQQVSTVFATPAAQRGKLIPPLLKQLATAKDEACDPAFSENYQSLETQLEELLATEPAPTKKP